MTRKQTVWRSSSYQGNVLPFAKIDADDDRLHAIPDTANFTTVETFLHGFNIPAANIYCNIYFLWHPRLSTMSAHVFVYRGAKILRHQLQADYFHEHQYLPAVRDANFELVMGHCKVTHRVIDPLRSLQITFDDTAARFALDLQLYAALPPVGRPGGQHFTQLMRTSGKLTLDGERHEIDGHYMRDRSWSYRRPETPEQTPPYRWITGWLGEELAFVIAWMDVGLLDDPRFGPHWRQVAADATGANKWESGGPTPSVELRSGWIAVRGEIRQVLAMHVRSRLSGEPRLLTEAIELELTDSSGDSHFIVGRTVAMIPKMYWQNLITYMHALELQCGTLQGHGDLMDTFSGSHMRLS